MDSVSPKACQVVFSDHELLSGNGFIADVYVRSLHFAYEVAGSRKLHDENAMTSEYNSTQ